MSDLPPGVFIVFEGIDGSGKTTQAETLTMRLREAGRRVVLTREPGGTAVGERIRDMLLNLGEFASALTPEAEALLFAAARASHVHRTVRPALLRGDVVVCDRYELSTLAYQGCGRGLDVRELSRTSAWATDGLQPDLTVLLHLDPAAAVSRRGTDRIEGETVEFHTRVAAGFLEHVGRPHLILEATRHPDHIAAEVYKHVEQLITERVGRTVPGRWLAAYRNACGADPDPVGMAAVARLIRDGVPA